MIYLVRDPIDRVLSHYVHYYSDGQENNPLTEALADLNCHYIWRSSYFMQLEQYLPYFSLARFLIVDHDDLLHHRRQALQQIFTFLEVDPHFDSLCFDNIRHESRLKRRAMPLAQAILTARPLRFAGSLVAPRVCSAIKRILHHSLSRPIQRPTLDTALPEHLIRALKPDAMRLRQLTGRKFAHWSV